jgi:hypothetical protein
VDDRLGDRLTQISAVTNQNRLMLMNTLSQLTVQETTFASLWMRLDGFEAAVANALAKSPEPHHEATVLASPRVRVADESDMNNVNIIRKDVRNLTERLGYILQDLLKVKTALGPFRDEIREVVFRISAGSTSSAARPRGLRICGHSTSATASRRSASPVGILRTTRTDMIMARHSGSTLRSPRQASLPMLGVWCRRQKCRTAPSLRADPVRTNNERSPPLALPGPAVPKNGPSERSLRTPRTSQSRSRKGSEPSLTVRPIVRAVDGAGVGEMLAAFVAARNELMIAVERTVDGDMVEGLFSKFKTVIVDVNQRVSSWQVLSTGAHRSRTSRQSHMPMLRDHSAGVKIGTECICCERADTTVSGRVP